MSLLLLCRFCYYVASITMSIFPVGGSITLLLQLYYYVASISNWSNIVILPPTGKIYFHYIFSEFISKLVLQNQNNQVFPKKIPNFKNRTLPIFAKLKKIGKFRLLQGLTHSYWLKIWASLTFLRSLTFSY